MDQSQKIWRFFKIPKAQSEEKLSQDLTIIGVLDASGSMSSYWSVLARQYNKIIENQQNVFSITFDSTTRLKNVPTLSETLHDHGGGTTNISEAFNKVNSLLQGGTIKTQNITIIFVSDGQDTTSNTLKERLEKLSKDYKGIKQEYIINFLCVAVGQGFPTFIAMMLREIYHMGDSSASPVYLIDTQQAGDKELLFQEQFELLRPFLGRRTQLQLIPGALKYPWDSEPVQQIYDNFWVCSQTDAQIQVVDQQTVQVIEGIQLPNIQDAIDICRQWVQCIQLGSLKNQMGQQAKIGLELMVKFRENLRQEHSKKKLSFADRMKLKGSQNLDEDINLLIREMRKFAENELLSKLSQEEAAKRLAIGTRVGAYHSKAIKLKGLTVEDYTQARDIFVKLIQKNKINYQKSSQEQSVISMQNTKDVLGEPDLVEGLKLCQNQYDLVTTLPLIGHGILLKRSEGSLINPWLIWVKGIARHHKVVDSLAIQGNGNEIELQTGDGQTEKINCVLPLFDDQLDSDLKGVLQSRLFHILMTFNVMVNADTCYETAYAALLANTLYYLIQQPQSFWRDEQIELIYKTAKLTYLPSSKARQYIDSLTQNPALAVCTEHPDINTKCEDITKAIFALFMKNESEPLDKKKIEEITQRMICEAIARIYPADLSITSFYEIANKEMLQQLNFEKHVEHLLSLYPKNNLLERFYHLHELKNDLSQQVMKLDLKVNVSFTVTFNPKKLHFLKNQSKINLDALQSVHEFFTGRPIEQDELIAYLYHARITNSYQRATQPINFDTNDILKQVSAQITSEVLTNNSIFKDTFTILEKEYQSQMQETHKLVLPMSHKQLQAYCQQNGLNSHQYKIGTLSNLFKNACMAVKCPHYMKLNPSFSSHMASSPLVVPAFHKTIVENYDLASEQLFEMIAQGKCMDNRCPHMSPMSAINMNAFIAMKQEVLENIEKIKEKYKQMYHP